MRSFFNHIRSKIYTSHLFTLHQRSARAINRWQLSHVKELIGYITKTVPAYAALLKEKNVVDVTFGTMKDIEALPITSKKFFLGRPVEEYTNNNRNFKKRWKKTSGTSGEPFTLLLGQWATDALFCNFTMFRFLVWDNLGITRLKKARIARIDVRARPDKNLLFIKMEDFRKDPEAALRLLFNFKPDLIASYTSILLDLAQILSEKRSSRPKLTVKYIVSIGEMLSPAARKKMEEAFGGEVYDRYGMGEVTGAIAVECRQHEGMHVNSESVFVEIVDDEGRVVPHGERGRIIVTDLLNYNMPFIRYDTGDHGFFLTEPCPCGLKTPRLRLEGRYSAYLTFGDKRINHLEFDGALDGMMNVIVQYLVVKHSESSLTVRIVPGSSFDEAARKRIAEKIAHVVGDGISVQIERVSTLPPTPRGKSKIVLDESPSANR